MTRTLTQEELDRLDQCFNYHPPTGDKGDRHATIRRVLKSAARDVLEQCPPSRETAIALSKLREAMFWANAAIACEQPSF